MIRKRVQLTLSYLLSGVIALTLLFTSYALLWPVDVLKDWYITADQATYHPSDIITVTSRYTKVRDVSGESRRYLECRNSNGTTSRYPLSEGVANRPPTGGTASEVYFRVPEDIPNLPVSCRVRITVEYKIYSFRSFTETNYTNDFTVEPAAQASTSNMPQASQVIVSTSSPTADPLPVNEDSPAPHTGVHKLLDDIIKAL